MNIFAKLAPAKPSEVYNTYWTFAAKRQQIFFERFEGTPPPWTHDRILLRHKFTNAYRAADRVSQYLIKNVLYGGEQAAEEVFFRCVLFKIFNRPSTWELLQAAFGDVRFSAFSLDQYDQVLAEARVRGDRIFSAAYIMPSHSAEFDYPSKHRAFLALLARMMSDKVPAQLQQSKSMAAGFRLLRGFPLIGDFLAYQFATDLNYSALTDFSEMEFVVAGPGAKSGIRKCFTTTGDLSEADIIKFMADQQVDEFARLGLEFRSLWGRPLQLIDCQNLFCEVDKYARIAHPNVRGTSDRTRIKQKFTPNPQVIHYWFPPKWGLNTLIEPRSEPSAAQTLSERGMSAQL